jgi:phospholipase C
VGDGPRVIAWSPCPGVSEATLDKPGGSSASRVSKSYEVYNAIRANKPLWESTLFVILFDEHGGLYDHVPPPPATPPDLHQEEYTFDRLGVRVPALLISPFLQPGLLTDIFDHTSLLRFAVEKWDLGALGNRTAGANTFSDKFASTLLNIKTPEWISGLPPNISPIKPLPQIRLSDHQLALFALSHALEAMSDAEPSVVATRAANVLSGIHSQVDAMVDRLEGFLAHSKAKLSG